MTLQIVVGTRQEVFRTASFLYYDLLILFMKLLLLLPVLLVLSIGLVGIEDVFAGGEAYQNRANGYWLQIYMTIAILIGIITVGSIIIYKLMKGKLSIYGKTEDMRNTEK